MSAATPEEAGRSTRLKRLLESGGQVVGNVAGVAVAIVTDPFLGAGAGAAMGEALSRVGAEVHDRVLAPRQHARAGGALGVAVARIRERIDEGDILRADGFFDAEPDERADADEVLEGTLITAANSWEERKVPLLGRYYANLAFDDTVSPGWANYLLRTADGLTYNQLVLLGLLVLAEQPGSTYERAFVNLEVVPSAVRVAPDPTLYEELDGLSSARLVGVRQRSGPPAMPNETLGGSRWEPSRLLRATLTDQALKLHQLMELDALPRADVDEILNRLVGDRDP